MTDLVNRQLPLVLGRRGRGPRVGHRRHRAGQPTAAAPDPRPGPGRDDPHVRAPRRGAARRARGRAHRRRRRAAAARQRRGAAPAGPARRRRGPAGRAISASTPPPPSCWPPGAAATDEVHLDRGPAAGGQPAAHRRPGRPAGQRRHAARLHRAARAGRPGRGGARAAEAAVRRRGGHRHHAGRQPHRRGTGARSPCPRFADFVTVDLPDAGAARGGAGGADEPRCAGRAVGGIREDAPAVPGGRADQVPPVDPAGPRAWHPGRPCWCPTCRRRPAGRRRTRSGPRRSSSYGIHSLDHRAAARPAGPCWAWSTSGARRSPSPSTRTTCPSPRSWSPAPRSASTTPAATPASTPWP